MLFQAYIVGLVLNGIVNVLGFPNYAVNDRLSNRSEFHKDCGRQAIEPIFWEGRIINGHEAAFNSWPWQASLYAELDSFNIIWYICGGAIISNRWILTAAHCVFLPPSITIREWIVYAGEQYKDHPAATVQSRRVEKYIMHKNFIFANKSNDIALLKLAKPFVWTNEIHPICLPSGVETRTDDVCVVAGFRHNESRHIPQQAIFHQLRTPIIDHETCSGKEFYDRVIPENVICSGHLNGFNDTCHGDSGRPLMCYENGRWVSAGILSYGDIECGLPKKPGIYTRVSSYIPWIMEVLKREEPDKFHNSSDTFKHLKLLFKT